MKIDKGANCPANGALKAGSQFCKERCPWYMGEDRNKIDCEKKIVKEGVMYNERLG